MRGKGEKLEGMENFNVRAFIEQVRTRPLLYDQDAHGYTDLDAKREAWEAVLEECLPNWEDLGEKDDMVNILRKKWKVVRDSYVRETRLVKADNTKKIHYRFFDQLRFLGGDDFIPETPVSEKKTKKKSQVQNSKQSPPPKRSKTERTPGPFEGRPTAPKPSAPVPSVPVHSVPVPPVTVPSVPVPAAPVSGAPPAVTSSDSSMSDEGDRLFLMSLLSDMKRVPEQLKLEVKCELLHVIKRYTRFESSLEEEQCLIPARMTIEEFPVRPIKESPPHFSEESE